MNKLIITSILLVIIISYLVNHLLKNKSKKINNSKDISNDISNDKNVESLIIDNGDDIIQNVTQQSITFNDDKDDSSNLSLIEAFKEIKSNFNGIMIIKGDYEVEIYNKFLISEDLKNEFNIVLNPIIDVANKLSKTNYEIIEYDNAEIRKNPKDKLEQIYIITFFIYDSVTLIRKKIFIEIYKKNNVKHINYLKNSNCKILDNSCFLESHPNITNKSVRFNLNNSYHSKSVHNPLPNVDENDVNQNSKDFRLQGRIKTNLENSRIKDYNNFDFEHSIQRNEWILPENVAKTNSKAWPCKQVKHEWGKYGILKTTPDTKDCYGNNMATQKRPIHNNFTPDHVTLEKNLNQYNDLFVPETNQHTNWH